MDIKDHHSSFASFILLMIGAILLSFLSIFGLCLITKNHAVITFLISIFSHQSFFNLVVFGITKLTQQELFIFTVLIFWAAILIWFELFIPGTLKHPLTLRTPEIYLSQKKTLPELLEMFPLLCPRVPLAHRIAFCTNPFSIVIAALGLAKAIIIMVVDSQPKSARLRFESDLPHQIIKGVIVLAYRLVVTPLKVIEPVAFIPYLVLRFLFVTLPHFFEWLFFTETPTLKIRPRQQPVKLHASTAYIRQRLMQPLNPE